MKAESLRIGQILSKKKEDGYLNILIVLKKAKNKIKAFELIKIKKSSWGQKKIICLYKNRSILNKEFEGAFADMSPISEEEDFREMLRYIFLYKIIDMNFDEGD